MLRLGSFEVRLSVDVEPWCIKLGCSSKSLGAAVIFARIGLERFEVDFSGMCQNIVMGAAGSTSFCCCVVAFFFFVLNSREALQA